MRRDEREESRGGHTKEKEMRRGDTFERNSSLTSWKLEIGFCEIVSRRRRRRRKLGCVCFLPESGIGHGETAEKQVSSNVVLLLLVVAIRAPGSEKDEWMGGEGQKFSSNF